MTPRYRTQYNPLPRTSSLNHSLQLKECKQTRQNLISPQVSLKKLYKYGIYDNSQVRNNKVQKLCNMNAKGPN